MRQLGDHAYVCVCIYVSGCGFKLQGGLTGTRVRGASLAPCARRNPLTGQQEFGLHRRKWEEYNPDKPDK